MKLYVVRHGETASNVSGVVSGRSEEGLTEKGIMQAEILNQKIADTKFDAVFVSPMRRTLQTAEIIVPEYDYVVDERISERDLGTLKGYTIDELWQMPLWNSLTEKRTKEGAETFAAGIERVQDFLSELKANYGERAVILLITHSFISRCIWKIANGIQDSADFFEFSHKNDEIKIYHI
ncbi:histidine phosphatase family protein [Candidatus Saccharibacteria bacterium]|nr:histidine phosphatase family protein [Candidatus Saccharibacteria bacterium]